MQANEFGRDEAPFTIIAFIPSEQGQEALDLHPRVDNYIVMPEGNINSLKKAVIRFLTNPLATGGKELTCLVRAPHAARYWVSVAHSQPYLVLAAPQDGLLGAQSVQAGSGF